jgi:hypothetical protein
VRVGEAEGEAGVMVWTNWVSGASDYLPRMAELGYMVDIVTVSPSPQPKNTTGRSIVVLRKYARDFRCQHTTDAEYLSYDLDEEDYGLAIGCLVVT